MECAQAATALRERYAEEYREECIPAAQRGSVRSAIASAEQGMLELHVKDPQGKSLANVQLATAGPGSTSPLTDRNGKTRLRLAPQTRAGTWVTLRVVRAPRDLVFVSPWDERVMVPPFESESDNYVPIILANKDDRTILASGAALMAMVARINKVISPKTPEAPSQEEQKRRAMDEVSRSFGLPVADIDKAIRAWGHKTKNEDERGMVALYEKNYPEASRQLAESLRVQEANLQKAHADIANTAFFLGVSLYEEGRYKESSRAYERALELRPDDPVTMNGLGLAFSAAAEYTRAEPLIQRALAIREKALGPEHLDTAQSLNSLAGLLRDKGDYAGAEPLFRRAVAIREKSLGPEHSDTATSLHNLALVLREKGDYAGAEGLHRRALAIWEKVLGTEHPRTAASLNSLAFLLHEKRDYAGAEPLYRRALRIREKALGPEHPDTANSLNNLAGLLQATGDYAGVEPLLRRALRIREKVLGPEHATTAQSLNNLAGLLSDKGDYSGAEPLLRRAQAIYEKALGPEHPSTQTVRKNYEELRGKLGAVGPKKTP